MSQTDDRDLPGADDADDVQGHKHIGASDDILGEDDEVQGHKHIGASDETLGGESDDAEGHKYR